jgi:hypoxanthine phosphoribosyltransferase
LQIYIKKYQSSFVYRGEAKYCKLHKKQVNLQKEKNIDMDKITIKDKTFVKYITTKEIDIAVEKLAHQINHDYQGKTPIMLVVLNGAILFASDLLKKLTIDCEVSCIKVSSYDGGLTSTNNLKSIIGLNTNVNNRDVIIVEDIVDTGLTVSSLVAQLKESTPASVKIAALTFKKEAYKIDLPVDYVAIEIPNKFIVGYGLDYDELGRNLPDIYQLFE